jgi:hypothetical protein
LLFAKNEAQIESGIRILRIGGDGLPITRRGFFQ